MKTFFTLLISLSVPAVHAAEKKARKPANDAAEYNCSLKTLYGSQSVRFGKLKDQVPQKMTVPGKVESGFVELTRMDGREYSAVKAVFQGEVDGPLGALGGTASLFMSGDDAASNTVTVSYGSQSVALACSVK